MRYEKADPTKRATENGQTPLPLPPAVHQILCDMLTIETTTRKGKEVAQHKSKHTAVVNFSSSSCSRKKISDLGSRITIRSFLSRKITCGGNRKQNLCYLKVLLVLHARMNSFLLSYLSLSRKRATTSLWYCSSQSIRLSESMVF